MCLTRWLTKIPTAMSDLEKYINDDDELDILIQVALIYHQFETIHVFGRQRTYRPVAHHLIPDGQRRANNSYVIYFLFF